MTIPAVGTIVALTWALEIGDIRRFSSLKHVISYCGLYGAERSRSLGGKATANSDLQTTQQPSANDVGGGGEISATLLPAIFCCSISGGRAWGSLVTCSSTSGMVIRRTDWLRAGLLSSRELATPRCPLEMALLYEREKQKGNRNRATLAMARKLAAYLSAVDRGERMFQPVAPSQTNNSAIQAA